MQGDVVEEVRTVFESLNDETIFIPIFAQKENHLTSCGTILDT